MSCNLHLILVLCPSDLISPAPSPSSSTDLGFRFTQDDFMLKMPVVMLRSVGDLLRYIDEHHLTTDFTAKVEYCHSDWVVLRTDDIRSVLKEGRLLQANLESSTASARDGVEERDIQADSDTVHRLLAQLRDMEEAFDGFFEKHHMKLQQYHQLLCYEISFQQMEEALENLSVQEKAISSAGATVVQTEQLLRDLEALDSRAQEEMNRAQVVILHGHQLAASHHYAMALIVQRCNELRHICDDALQYLTIHQERAPSALRNSHDTLSLELEAILTPQLQAQIAMVTDKLSSVQCMIRNREQCLRKLADVQVRPIQPVAPRPEQDQLSQRCKSPLFSPKHGVDLNVLNSKFSFDLLPGKRTARRNSSQRKIEVMHDYQGNHSCLYGTLPDTDSEAEDHPEQVTRLFSCVSQGYRAEMEDPAMASLLPTSLRHQKDLLFGNMPEIYQFHSRVFLQELQGCLDTPERVGACFLQQELLKHCPEQQYGWDLQEALDAMLKLLKSVNDSMHQVAITGYPGDLSQLGRVVLQGAFSVWISHKRAAVRMKDLARFKPMQRHLFLYEHAMLFCKRRDDERTPFYSFKHCLRMSAVGITENVKGDVKKFELWYSGREEVYVVQASTLEVKVCWLTEIRKILTKQQKLRQATVGGCSACLHVPHSSTATSHAHRSPGEESTHSSPAHSEPVVQSPRRSWPAPAHTVAVCEGLEDWGATDLSNISDSDDEQPAPLVAGRYRVMVESSMASTDDIIFNCGDVIQLLHEEPSGMWLVRNVSRGEEGRVLPEDLHRILGETD
ncbi:hypothetical protein CRUP_020030 [Coryphaenoides rupestris]|nr:hypothetical protein CRUP_020030 [Coryphaenoides rupestris]